MSALLSVAVECGVVYFWCDHDVCGVVCDQDVCVVCDHVCVCV